MKDTNFDEIAGSFEKEIYGSSKGYVRLQVLLEDLFSEVPQIGYGGLTILDAGGGAGHVSVRVAQFDNTVILSDPSQEMLDRAEKAVGAAGVVENVTTLRSSIQDLGATVNEEFDVVLCHAVLEWLAEPKETLENLVSFLKDDGLLSLMFYNQNAARMKQVFHGDFEAILRGDQVDHPSPLATETVSGWLKEFGLAVRSKSGIRIFHDYLPNHLRTGGELEKLLEVEKRLRKQEPFSSLGQHIHLVCGHSEQPGSTD